METKLENYLVDMLVSYKFDYDPKTIKYEDCTTDQLKYLVYKKLGPDQKWTEFGEHNYISVPIIQNKILFQIIHIKTI